MTVSLNVHKIQSWLIKEYPVRTSSLLNHKGSIRNPYTCHYTDKFHVPSLKCTLDM